MKRSDTPSSLAAVLTQSPALNNNQRLAWSTWRSIVGHRVATHTMPTRLEGDTLHVAVSSALWASELSLLQTPILAKLRAVLPRVHLLRFRVGPVDAPRDATPPVRIHRAQLPPELGDSLNQLADTQLGAIMREAAAYSLGRAQANSTQNASTSAGKASGPAARSTSAATPLLQKPRNKPF